MQADEPQFPNVRYRAVSSVDVVYSMSLRAVELVASQAWTAVAPDHFKTLRAVVPYRYEVR